MDPISVCKYCEGAFISYLQLEMHEELYCTKKKSFLANLKHSRSIKRHCEICNKGLTSDFFYFQHMKTHQKKYRCNVCRKTFSTANVLARHAQIHCSANRLFECRICRKKFFTAAFLHRHEKRHAIYECEFCARVFTYWTNLNEHRPVCRLITRKTQTTHTVTSAEVQEEVTGAFYETEGPNVILECPVCFQKFQDQGEFIQHRGQHDWKLNFCAPDSKLS